MMKANSGLPSGGCRLKKLVGPISNPAAPSIPRPQRDGAEFVCTALHKTSLKALPINTNSPIRLLPKSNDCVITIHLEHLNACLLPQRRFYELASLSARHFRVSRKPNRT